MGKAKKKRGKPKRLSFKLRDDVIYIGIDEAGRGCLAGNVYAAAVILDPADKRHIRKFKDSKELAPEEREKLFDAIVSRHRYGIGSASVEEITKWNILRASHIAMCRAILKLKLTADEMKKAHILIDGNLKIKKFEVEQTPIIAGDRLVKAISAASILAKVSRDREAKRWHELYPGYGFAEHKGYATPTHRENIQKLGPCPIHRPTFAGVAEYLSLEATDSPLDVSSEMERPESIRPTEIRIPSL